MSTVPQASIEADQRLDEELDRKHPPSWRPEGKGDTIRGEFVRLDYADKFDCPVAVLDAGDGERGIFMFHAVLKSKLARLAPKTGERVAIRYDGQVTSTDGKRRYHDYSVAVVREAQQSRLSWDDLADQPEPTSEPDVPMAPVDNPAPTGDDGTDIPF